MLNYLFFSFFWTAHDIRKMNTCGSLFYALNCNLIIFVTFWIIFVNVSDVLYNLHLLDVYLPNGYLGGTLAFLFYGSNCLYYLYKWRYISIIRNWRKYDDRKRTAIYFLAPIILCLIMFIISIPILHWNEIIGKL